MNSEPTSVAGGLTNLKLTQVLRDGRAVVRVGGGLEVSPEVGDGLGESLHPTIDQPPIPELGRGIGMDEEQALNRAESAGEIVSPEIDPLQVVQDPGEDQPLRNGEQQIPMERHLAPVHPVEGPPAVLFGEEDPAMERVDEDVPLRTAVLHDKVPGQAHSDQRETEAPGHFHVNDGEGDRNALPAIDDLVEEAVLRVVIVLRIPLKSLLLEETAVHFFDQDGRLELEGPSGFSPVPPPGPPPA